MGLGTPEIILIALALLLIFGAKRIPEIARGLGKGMREFKDATKDIQRELTVEDSQRSTYRPQPPAQAAPQPQAPPAQPPAQQAAQPAQAAPAPDAAASGPAQASDQTSQS